MIEKLSSQKNHTKSGPIFSNYFSVFYYAPVGMLISVDGIIVESNKMASRLLGFEEGELYNEPMLSIWPAIENLNTREPDMLNQCSSSLFVDNQILKRKDGSMFWSEIGAFTNCDSAPPTMVWTFNRSRGTEPSKENLSAREKQMAAAILSGKTNKVIAKDTDLSVRTVEYYRQRLMRKLQVGNRTELVLRLMRL